MICIIDYGSSNIRSIFNAFKYLKYDVVVSNDPKSLARSDKLILPGVGTYKNCINKLKAYNIIDEIKNHINIKQKPFLGICVGFHILSKVGFEINQTNGLNVIGGKVVKLEIDQSLDIPHMGWNKIKIIKNDILFKDLEENPAFYFLHSYHMDLKSKNDNFITSKCFYGIELISSISKDNIFGVQFHPEKSQENGLKLLDNFINFT